MAAAGESNSWAADNIAENADTEKVGVNYFVNSPCPQPQFYVICDVYSLKSKINTPVKMLF